MGLLQPGAGPHSAHGLPEDRLASGGFFMAIDPPSSGSVRRGTDDSQELFDSDALRINLEETAVDQVAVAPKYQILQETVSGYRGILKSLDTLLFELNHPYKNWEIILPELRGFALKHFASYSRHPKGPLAVSA